MLYLVQLLSKMDNNGTNSLELRLLSVSFKQKKVLEKTVLQKISS